MLPLVSHCEYAHGTDRQTDGRQTVTLRFPLDAASVMLKHDRRTAGRVHGPIYLCTISFP